MWKLLVIVDELFDIPGRGLVVVPNVSILAIALTCPTKVMLVRPDETIAAVEVSFMTPFLDPPTASLGQPSSVILMKHIDKTDVPIGSALYIEEMGGEVESANRD